MGSRFAAWLLASFFAALAALGGIGAGVSMLWVNPPRELYRSPAIEFDLAPGWWCERDGTEDICRPEGQPPHSAIAIIALKERGAHDNLRAYEEHLEKPQRTGDRSAAEGPVSVVRYVRRRTLGERDWIESLHIGSEIANYHTYYLATTTSHIGILVTLSVRQDQEAHYIAQFTEMMSTLKTYQR